MAINYMKYMTNISKSVGEGFKDALAGNMSNSKDMYTGIKEVKTDLGYKLDDLKYKLSDNQDKSQDYFSHIKEAIDNAVSDLKSGKLYNKERLSKIEDSQFEDDDSNFNVDFDSDDFIDKEDDLLEKYTDQNDKKMVTLNEITNSNLIKGNKLILGSVGKATSTILEQNLILTSSIQSSLKEMNVYLKGMYEFRSVTSSFYETSSSFFNDMKSEFAELKSVMMPLYKQETKIKDRKSVTDIFSNNIDLQKYAQAVKSNFEDTEIGFLLGMLIPSDEMSMDMVKTEFAKAKASPLSYLTKLIASKSLSPAKSHLKEADIVGKNFFRSLLLKAYNNRSGKFNFLTEILGIGPGSTGTVDTKTYEKGAIQYNGIANRAITQVIPTYLRKILAAITGKNEMVYDYNTGKFRDMKSITNEVEERRKRAIFNMDSYDAYDDLDDKLVDLGVDKYMTRLKFQDKMRELMTHYSKKGKFFNPNEADYDLDGIEELNLSRDEFTTLNRLFKLLKLSSRETLSTKAYSDRDELRRLNEDLSAEYGIGGSTALFDGFSKNKKGLGYNSILGNNKKGGPGNKGGGPNGSPSGPSSGSSKYFNLNNSPTTVLGYLRDIRTILMQGVRTYSLGVVDFPQRMLGKSPLGSTEIPIYQYMIDQKQIHTQGKENKDEENDYKEKMASLSEKSFNELEKELTLETEMKDEDEKEARSKKFKNYKGDVKGLISKAFYLPSRISKRVTSEFTRRIDRILYGEGGMIENLKDRLDVDGKKNTVSNLLKDKILNPANRYADGVESGINSFLFGDEEKESPLLLTDGSGKTDYFDPKYHKKKSSFGFLLDKLKGKNGFVDTVGQKIDSISKTVTEKLIGTNDKEGLIPKLVRVIPERADKISNTLFGDSLMNSASKAFNYIKSKLPVLGKGALLGALGGLLLPGLGIIPGMMLGSVTNFAISNAKVKKYLFGDENKEGGLIPKSIQERVKKYGKKMALSGGLGAIASTVLTGNPVIGLVVGSALGYASKSDRVKKFLFGDGEDGEKRGLISKEWREKIKSILPKGIKNSAIIGGLSATSLSVLGLSGALFTPAGLIGVGVLGMGSALLNSSEKFKDLFWGKEYADGKRAGGVFGKIKFAGDMLARKFQIFTSDRLFDIEHWFRKNIGANILKAFEPIKTEIKYQAKNIVKNISKRFAKGIEHSFIGKLGKMVNKVFIKPLGGILSKVLHIFSLKRLVGLLGATVSSPFRLLGFMGDKLTDSQVRRGIISKEEGEARKLKNRNLFNDIDKEKKEYYANSKKRSESLKRIDKILRKHNFDTSHPEVVSALKKFYEDSPESNLITPDNAVVKSTNEVVSEVKSSNSYLKDIYHSIKTLIRAMVSNDVEEKEKIIDDAGKTITQHGTQWSMAWSSTVNANERHQNIKNNLDVDKKVKNVKKRTGIFKHANNILDKMAYFGSVDENEENTSKPGIFKRGLNGIKKWWGDYSERSRRMGIVPGRSFNSTTIHNDVEKTFTNADKNFENYIKTGRYKSSIKLLNPSLMTPEMASLTQTTALSEIAAATKYSARNDASGSSSKSLLSKILPYLITGAGLLIGFLKKFSLKALSKLLGKEIETPIKDLLKFVKGKLWTGIKYIGKYALSKLKSLFGSSSKDIVINEDGSIDSTEDDIGGDLTTGVEDLAEDEGGSVVSDIVGGLSSSSSGVNIIINGNANVLGKYNGSSNRLSDDVEEDAEDDSGSFVKKEGDTILDDAESSVADDAETSAESILTSSSSGIITDLAEGGAAVTGGSILTATGRTLTSYTSKAFGMTKSVASKFTGSGVIDSLKTVISNFMDNDIVADIFSRFSSLWSPVKQVFLTAVEKVSTSSATDILGEITTKIADFMGGGIFSAGIIPAALITYEAISGATDARDIFQVSKTATVTWGMRIACAIAKIFSSILFFVTTKWLATEIYKAISKLDGNYKTAMSNLNKEQSAETKAYNEYVEEQTASGKTAKSKSSYVSSTDGGFWSDIDSGISDIGSFVSSTFSDAVNGVLGIGSDIVSGLEKAGSDVVSVGSDIWKWVTGGGYGTSSSDMDGNIPIKRRVIRGFGSSAITGTTSTPLKVNGMDYYSQYNPTWANDPYNGAGQTGATIESSGCGPTSAAMVISSLTGEDVTPVMTADYSMDNGYRIPGEGTSWALFKPLGKKYGVDISRISTSSVQSALENRDPVILSGTGTAPFTDEGHFVVGAGIDGDTIYINDPIDVNRSKGYSLSSVLSQTSAAWVATKNGKGLSGTFTPGYTGTASTSSSTSSNSSSSSDDGLFSAFSTLESDTLSLFGDIMENKLWTGESSSSGSSSSSSSSYSTLSDVGGYPSAVASYKQYYEKYGKEYGFPGTLIAADDMQESGGNVDSSGGGLAQLTGSTQDVFAEWADSKFGSSDIDSAQQQIAFQAYVLGKALSEYDGDYVAALQGWNYGYGAINELMEKYGSSWYANRAAYAGTDYGDYDYLPHLLRYYSGNKDEVMDTDTKTGDDTTGFGTLENGMDGNVPVKKTRFSNFGVKSTNTIVPKFTKVNTLNEITKKIQKSLSKAKQAVSLPHSTTTVTTSKAGTVVTSNTKKLEAMVEALVEQVSTLTNVLSAILQVNTETAKNIATISNQKQVITAINNGNLKSYNSKSDYLKSVKRAENRQMAMSLVQK